jgi:hypothetical protein
LGGHDRHAQLEGLAAELREIDFAVLRSAAFGDVEPRHDLDARNQRRPQLGRQPQTGRQIAVAPEADDRQRLARVALDVDAGRAGHTRQRPVQFILGQQQALHPFRRTRTQQVRAFHRQRVQPGLVEEAQLQQGVAQADNGLAVLRLLRQDQLGQVVRHLTRGHAKRFGSGGRNSLCRCHGDFLADCWSGWHFRIQNSTIIFFVA